MQGSAQRDDAGPGGFLEGVLGEFCRGEKRHDGGM